MPHTGPGTRWWREHISAPLRALRRPCHLHRYGMCKFNGAPIDYTAKWPHPRSFSVDHKVPSARGGAHTWSNVDASHHACNCARHDTPLPDLEPPPPPPIGTPSEDW